MIRKAFVMKLTPGMEEEYWRRHNPIWKELEEVLRLHGVQSYSIFLHPESYQLFAYAEIENEDRWQSIASTPECRRWWDFLAELMEINEDHSPKTTELREVFHLGNTTSKG